MNNKDKLYNLYLQLEPTIGQLEKTRKLNLLLIILLSILLNPLNLVFVPDLDNRASTGTIWFIVGYCIGLLFPFLFVYFYYVSFSSLFKQYKASFQKELIIKLINITNYDFEYYPDLLMDLCFIQSSLLWRTKTILNIDFPESYYYRELLIKGKNFKFSKLKISDGEDYIFKGLFVIIDLPRNTKTVLGTSKNISKNKILLDNTEFNEFFPIYAENTTEAFYILPSNMQERLVDFVHKTGRKFDFSVVDDKFYIAIPYNRPLLEPPIFKSLFDYSIYEEYFTDLELAIGIVEDLKVA